LFDPSRKRPLPVMPRAIGLVTSLGAAALHDVVTALQRRVPHIPVVLAPASVQGANAPAELMAALSALYQVKTVPIDVILLVRGGGALEDLWAFNNEALARLMVQSPVPIICGVGHETDFTIADFVADLRAPTPTAAAELVAQPREAWLGALDQAQRRLSDAVLRTLDRQGQRLDRAVARLGRPSERLASQHLRLAASAHGLHSAARHFLQQKEQHQQRLATQLPTAVQRAWQQQAQRLERASLRLNLLDPHLVLARGYAMLSDAQGNTVASCRQTAPGQALTATLVDGTVDLRVV
jgi:exodeoxyribonuclease VII large subunit